jgi:hypothetical protein
MWASQRITTPLSNSPTGISRRCWSDVADAEVRPSWAGANTSASSARTSGRYNVTSPACAVASASKPLAWLRCQAWASSMSVSRSSAVSNAPDQLPVGCGSRMDNNTPRSRSRYSADRPARSTSLESTSSSGKDRPSQARSVSSAVTPSRIRSHAVVNVFCRMWLSPRRSRRCWPSAHRAPAAVVYCCSVVLIRLDPVASPLRRPDRRVSLGRRHAGRRIPRPERLVGGTDPVDGHPLQLVGGVIAPVTASSGWPPYATPWIA